MGRRKLKSKSKGGESQKKEQNIQDVVQSSSSASSLSSSGVELTEKIESRDKAFSIDLIWRKLGQCLNYNDLKALRLVSTQFNNAILYQTNFINKSAMRLLVDHRLNSSDFGSTNISWKHFKITQLIFSEKKNKKKNKFGLFYPMLKCAQSIEVSTHINSFAVPHLHEILAAPAPNTLKKLVLHTNVLICPTAPIVLWNLPYSAKNNLRGLQEFHISAVTQFWGSYYKNEHFVRSIDFFNLHVYNLRVIRIENILLINYKYDKLELLADFLSNNSIIDMNQSLIKLIERNQKSLVELHAFDLYMWLKFTDLPVQIKILSLFDMIFPRLKSLSITTLNQEDYITKFLDKQPELEELNITILYQFPVKVMRKIGQKSKNLKKLHIKTNSFDEEKIGMWNFLKDLNSLEDFSMEFLNTPLFLQKVDSTKLLLSFLPRSIKKLCLIGFGSNDGVLDRYSLSATNFERLDGKKLTHLTLHSMSDGIAVNDETMEFICKNFTMLQHLNIYDSGVRVTDYGFSGINDKAKLMITNFSLQNLKGLRTLIFDCKNVTNRTFLDTLKFRELVHLQISVTRLDSRIVESETIPTILKSNPNLRTFYICGVSIQIPKMDEMRKWNQRIRTVEAIHEDPDVDEDGDESEPEEGEISDDSDDSHSEAEEAGDSSSYDEDDDDEESNSESQAVSQQQVKKKVKVILPRLKSK